MEAESRSGYSSGRKNNNAVVKIGGIGAAILVGGVLATTALTSAFLARKGGRPRDEAPTEKTKQAEDGDSHLDARGGNQGVESDAENTTLLVSPQSGLLGIEINGGGAFEEAFTQPNAQSLCVMEKLENGDSEYPIENTESHVDSIRDEAPGTEASGDILCHVSSQPSGQFIYASKMAENGASEYMIENSHSHAEDYNLDQITGAETNGYATPGDVSAQFMCAEKNVANGDAISSIEKIESPDDHNILGEMAETEISAACAPGDLLAEPNETICSTASTEKIQQLEYVVPVETTRIKTKEGTQDEESIESTDAESDAEKIQAPVQEADSSVQDPEERQQQLESTNASTGADEGVESGGNIGLSAASHTLKQSELPNGDAATDETSINVETVDPGEDKSGNMEESLVEASIESRQRELEGKLLEDRLMIKDYKDNEPKHSLEPLLQSRKSRYTAAVHEMVLPLEKNKYAMLVMANQTRRRMLIGAASVATSLALSNLMGLSFIKLCLIMLLTGLLSEIHAR